MDESQAGIKIFRGDINNHRSADNITLMAESEKELKSLLMRVKEDSEKAGLKVNIKNLRSQDSVLSLHGKYMGKMWKRSDFIFLGFKITVAVV